MRKHSSPAQTAWPRRPAVEPALDELLAEPIVQLLMSSDRVSPADIERTLDAARRRRGGMRREPGAATPSACCL
jgi:hypothetical protein